MSTNVEKQGQNARDNDNQEKHQAAEYNKFGWCQIHEASYKGFMHPVKRIVENSFDKTSQLELFTRDENCVTPIVIAVLGGHFELVEYLVEAGANLTVRNNKGHGIIEIAAIRQDFKMLNYLINLNSSSLNPYIWPYLVRLLAYTEDEMREMSTAAIRSLESLTDHCLYKNEPYTEQMWTRNCAGLVKNNIFKVLSKIITDFPKEHVISSLIIIHHILEYSGHCQLEDTLIQLLRQNGYVCLINFTDKIKFKDNDEICLFGRVLNKMSSTSVDAKAFLRQEFLEYSETFFSSVIRSLADIKEPSQLYSFINFIINILKFNNGIDLPFDDWKNIVHFVVECPCSGHEKLTTSLLRLTCAICQYLPVIQYYFIEQGLASFVNETLKHDNENLRVTSMESIKELCLHRLEIQQALFNEKTDDYLFQLLNKYHTKFLKKTTINAIWAIAGDDILQRQMVVNKMSLSLINDCLSDNDNLSVIGCNALVVMLELPPNCTLCAHETFLKFESVPRLCRILTTTNQDPVNMMSALRCMRKLCAMCGDNCHRKAQTVVKNSEAMPLLISLIQNGKSDLIKAESAAALAYICLESKDHIKIALDELDFTYDDIFALLAKVQDKHVKLLVTRALAIFAYNNPEQEKLIKSHGILDCELFESFIEASQAGSDMDRCEAAYQTILLSQLIFNKEPSKLIMRGMRILIGYFEAKGTHINLRCFVAEKLVSLSRLKNGIAQALLDIDFVNILSRSLYVKNASFRGYVSIALSNLSAIPDGKRKLLKICRQDLSLAEMLEFYNNYPESNHRLSKAFMKEWNHVKIYFENGKHTNTSNIDTISCQ